MRTLVLSSFLPVALLTLTACDDDSSASTLETTVAFQAIADGEAIVFGDQTPGISETDSVSVYDLRFYLSDIYGVDVDGEAHRAELPTSVWTHDGGTALIDLADLTEGAGTAGVNNHVTLTLPDREYRALRFSLGVPFEHNHTDVSTAPAPFNMMSMNWGWRGGRIFFRLDGTTGEGNGAHIHVGSTGCQGDIDAITHCDQPNRPTIEIPWHPGQNIALDLTALYRDVDVNSNTEETGALCMASPDDPECEPFFVALGLPFGETPAQEQRVFTATDAPIVAASSSPSADGDAPADHGDHGDDSDHGGHGDGNDDPGVEDDHSHHG